MKTTHEHFVFEVKKCYDTTVITCLVRSRIDIVQHLVEYNQVHITLGPGEPICFEGDLKERFTEWWNIV